MTLLFALIEPNLFLTRFWTPSYDPRGQKLEGLILRVRPLGEPRILVSGRGQINEEPACLPELVERREECTQAYMRIPSLFLTNLESKRQWLCKRSIEPMVKSAYAYY